jgi:hypothetical protein
MAQPITSISAKVIGGDAAGMLAVHWPNSMSEVAEFLQDSKDFLRTSDSYGVEITMINKDGLKFLNTLYKDNSAVKEATKTSPTISDDIFAATYAR